MMSNKKDYEEHLDYLKSQGVFDYRRDKEYWGNIPTPYTMLGELENIYAPSMKLLDLGCGSGQVLRFASNIGFDVTGVEIDASFEKYLKDYNYIIEDMRKLPESFYKGFDVVFSYLPLKQGEEDFVQYLIDTVEVGTYLVLPFHVVQDDRLKCIVHSYYQKTTI